MEQRRQEALELKVTLSLHSYIEGTLGYMRPCLQNKQTSQSSCLTLWSVSKGPELGRAGVTTQKPSLGPGESPQASLLV